MLPSQLDTRTRAVGSTGHDAFVSRADGNGGSPFLQEARFFAGVLFVNTYARRLEMHKKRVVVMCFVLCALAFTFGGCAGRGTGEPVAPKYLRQNIHAQFKDNAYNASYANWTNPGAGHVIIPVNTLAAVTTSRRDIVITTGETPNRTITMEFNDRNMKMDIDQYINVIASSRPTELSRLSALDRKGIKEGKAHKGMTKEGVRIALGYPAEHRTPSLASNTWFYWKNRFKYFEVKFDAHGRVTGIGTE